MIKKILRILSEILFPPICISCLRRLKNTKRNSDINASWLLCEICESAVEINTAAFCPKCGRRNPSQESLCHKEMRYILAAACEYNNPVVREIIHSLKYKEITSSIFTISDIIFKFLKISRIIDYISNNNFFIIPVPLHKSKERKRGFNQSLLIAEELNKNLLKNNYKSIDILNNCASRIKNTKSQTECKNNNEREKNAKGIFLCDQKSIKGKNILIIDDVFTSGATINELSKVLKENGAKKIIALVFAKT